MLLNLYLIGGNDGSKVSIPHTPTAKNKSTSGKGKVHCNKSIKENYLLKHIGEQITCLGIKMQKNKNHRLAWFNCDNQPLEIQWMKWIPQSYVIDPAFHICHKQDQSACLTISSNLNAGKWIVNLDLFTNNPLNITTQQWKIKTKTDQLVNPDSKLCLTSYDAESLFNTSIAGPLVRVDSCKKRPNIPMQQKWYLNPIFAC